MAQQGRPCPACGTPMIPIIYGYAAGLRTTLEMARRGEVEIGGGCVVRGDEPEWWCSRCKKANRTWAVVKPDVLLWALPIGIIEIAHLPPGTVVVGEEGEGDSIQVATHDGSRGWVNRSDLVRIRDPLAP